ncbi:hypothetical protein SISSUDRAFT_11261 [Sistotremastrum suecicum HHB10207 ss-3]|uniref:Uncharacterized protein n=1 Tax=Sistotremastrum suecicum HHB10207 ss-3 TaxID=1314776 RepID=A0A166J562_9AGAM|nr:hypothetical protein SISSUDRAFT_11261 [Sistotremastrum suecicum HHB10207 ss-3]
MPNHDDPHHMYRVRGPSPTASSVYTAGGDRVAASLSQNGGDQAWEAMDVTPYTQSTVYGYSDGVQPMDVHPSPVVRSQSDEDLPKAIASDGHSQASRNSSSATTTQKSGKFGGLSFGGKKSKWGLASMFGHHEKIHQQNPLPPVDELNVASSSSTPSLKRTQSSSTDSRSLPEMSPTGPTPSVVVTPILDPKQVKEEAKRVQKEAEKQRRIMLQKKQRDQARAVMQKRSLVLQQTGTMTDLDWIDRKRTGVERTEKGKQPMYSYSSTIDAAGARFGGEGNPEPSRRNPDQDEHRHKARRRDLDDDHSIGSSDVQSSRVSMISFATVDSDPGPRLRNRPSAYAITRATSVSSLRSSSGRSFSPSARSSNSLEQQLISEFNERATFAGPTASPPPMNGLSLSPTSGHWQGMNEGSYSNSGYHTNGHPHLTLPPLSSLNQHQLRAPGPGSPYELGTSSHPSSPGLGPPSVINPMFQVVSHPSPLRI